MKKVIEKLNNPYWTFALGIYDTYQIINSFFNNKDNHIMKGDLIGYIIQLITVFLLYYTLVYYKKLKTKTEKSFSESEFKNEIINEILTLRLKHQIIGDVPKTNKDLFLLHSQFYFDALVNEKKQIEKILINKYSSKSKNEIDTFLNKFYYELNISENEPN